MVSYYLQESLFRLAGRMVIPCLARRCGEMNPVCPVIL